MHTVKVDHGIRTVVDVDNGFKINRVSYLRFALSKLPRALKYVWPTYSVALWKTKATVSEWARFAWDIVCGALGVIPKVFADDARTDRCCVYIDTDIDFAVKAYGYAPKDVIAVGNPDLIRFGLSSNMIGSCLTQPLALRLDVMYVDAALISTGFVFKSEDEFIQHIIDTRDQLTQQGKHLLFKPHPGHSGTGILSALATAGVEICTNEDFVSRLQRCCACIVEPSSMAVFSALMGMPLFLANYGKLNEQRFGEVLTSYPRARLLGDVRDFSSLIAAEQADCDAEQTMHWIDQNAGPLPAEEMPERVANVVLGLISENNRSELN